MSVPSYDGLAAFALIVKSCERCHQAFSSLAALNRKLCLLCEGKMELGAAKEEHTQPAKG